MHNGRCLSGADSYTCDCWPKYSGTHCESKHIFSRYMYAIFHSKCYKLLQHEIILP